MFERYYVISPSGRNAEHVLKRVGDSIILFAIAAPRLKRSSSSAATSDSESKCSRARSVRCEEKCYADLSQFDIQSLVCFLDFKLFPLGCHQQSEVWIAFTAIFAAAISSSVTASALTCICVFCTEPLSWLRFPEPIWVRPGW